MKKEDTTPPENADETFGTENNMPKTEIISPHAESSQNDLTASLTDFTLQNLRIPGYTIIRMIQEGGMGVVYQARDDRLNRLVAIKMLLTGKQTFSKNKSRFRTEAEAIASLQHPNIIQIFEIGELDGLPFLVLEYCSHGDLEQKSRNQLLGYRELTKLMLTLTDAVAAAHQVGIIHRDLKPANVLFMANDTPKISDFGLAKFIDSLSSNTQTGEILGTPSYMAPEQASQKNGKVSFHTDVYSLGAILYKLLTGRPPFQAPTSVETMLQVIHLEPVSPKTLQPKIPKDLETICLKCLQKDPDRRYATASLLAEDLRCFLAGKEISARPPTTAERLQKYVQRHPTVSGLTFVVGMLALITIIVAFNGWQNTEIQRTIAAKERDHARDLAGKEKVAKLRAEKEKSLAEAAANRAIEAESNSYLTLARVEWQSLRNPYNGRVIGPIKETLEKVHREHRQWEWHFLNRQINNTGSTLTGHENAITAIALSPDSKFLVSASRDGVLKTWDVRERKLISTQTQENGCVTALSFHPTQNIFFSCDTEGIVKSWQNQNGALIDETVLDRKSLYSMAIPQSGEWVAVAGASGKIFLYSPKRGKLLDTISPSNSAIYAIATDATGRQIAFSDSDNRLVVCTQTNDRWQTKTLLEEFPGSLKCIDFSPDGKTLAVGGASDANPNEAIEQMRLLDLASGNLVGVLSGRHRAFTCVKFHPDGNRLVTGNQQGIVDLWNWQTAKHLHSYKGHEGIVTSVCFDNTGKQIISGSEDHTVKFWSTLHAHSTTPLYQHDQPIASMNVSTDGLLLASGTHSGDVVIHDINSKKVLHKFPGHKNPINVVSFSPDNTMLAVTTNLPWSANQTYDKNDGIVTIWDLKSGKKIREIEAHRSWICDLLWNKKKANEIYSASADGTLCCWDVNTGERLQNHELGIAKIRCMAFSPKGNALAIGCYNERKTYLWDIKSNSVSRVYSAAQQDKHEGTGKKARPNAVECLAFSPDQSILVTGEFSGNDNFLMVWPVSADDRIKKKYLVTGSENKPSRIQFSQDDSRMLSRLNGGTFLIWNQRFGHMVFDSQGFENSVEAVCYAGTNNEFIITANRSGLIEIWDGRPISNPK